MPDDFPAKIEKTAQEKGGSLVLKKEPREIPQKNSARSHAYEGG